jgi:hypothetical protein
MPTVQGAGTIGVPGLSQRNNRGQMNPVMGRTSTQGPGGPTSNAYELGEFLRNPFKGIQASMVQPFVNTWNDFSAGIQGLPYGGANTAATDAAAQAAGVSTAAGAEGAAAMGGF